MAFRKKITRFYLLVLKLLKIASVSVNEFLFYAKCYISFTTQINFRLILQSVIQAELKIGCREVSIVQQHYNTVQVDNLDQMIIYGIFG